MQSANSDFQLYVVNSQFSSGELNTSFKKGDVLEVNMNTRQVNWQGQIKSVKSIPSAIRHGWLRLARKDEIEFIRKTGHAPTRQFDGPDLAKIGAQRHKEMQDSIPEDLRGESSHISEVNDSRTLDEVSASDRYKSHENQRPTERAKSAAQRPAVPKSTTESSGPSEPQVPDESELTEAPVEYDVDEDVRIAREAAEELDRLHASEPNGEPVADETYPTECRVNFDYKKRLSADREKELYSMSLSDLTHLGMFLKGRDKREGYPRKITERVFEILDERKKKEQQKIAEDLRKPATKLVSGAGEAPQFPFPFDVNGDRKIQLHQLSMNLSLPQAEMVLTYYEKVDPAFAKQVLGIIANRRRKGATEHSNDNNKSNFRTSALPQGEMGLVAAMAGVKPDASTNQRKSAVAGAISNASDQDIVNNEVAPMDIKMLAGADSVEVSPINSIEGDTETSDIGNRAAPPEAQPVIGSEEGVTSVMALGGKLARNAAIEGIKAADGVEDVSGTIGDLQ